MTSPQGRYKYCHAQQQPSRACVYMRASPGDYLAPRQLGEALNTDEGCVAYEACHSIDSLRSLSSPEATECAPDGPAACQGLL